MKNSRPISIRPVIVGESVKFLQQEDMGCLATQEGLAELISLLVSYKEEGKPLYPEIYIFDHIELVKKVLPGSQFCYIGQGEKSKLTMLKAVKKCAPLTEGGWSIYILRLDRTFEFGVFKAGTTILSVSISEMLIENGSELVKAILIHQVADRLIEVRGIKSDSLLISFGNLDDSLTSPTDGQHNFIENVIKDVDVELREATRNFFRKLFLEVLQKGHGTLACTINHKKKELPKKLRDGIELKSALNISKTIKDVLEKDDLQANAVLEGQYSLVLGMMQSDGITVFKSNGEVVAYNVFVKHPEKMLKINTSGGARSRTFLTLCSLIGNGLESVYIQSQDGKIEFR